LASFDRDGEDRAEGRREEKLRSLRGVAVQPSCCCLRTLRSRPADRHARLPAVSHIASSKYPTLLNDFALANDNKKSLMG
jgi:hypothetical protein